MRQTQYVYGGRPGVIRLEDIETITLAELHPVMAA